jgi:iron complex outermembrane receptor protein
MIRGVYSRANRGPFLIDSYANYLWDREGRPSPGQIYFQGTQNLDLLTMDMIELGYRIKPANNFQADFEVFYTKTQNYGALYPDSISRLANGTPTDRPYVRMSYMNIATETEQMGITAEISYILNKNIVFKTFGTIQKSLITNNIIETPEGLITKMIVAAKAGKKTFFDQTPFNYIDEENKSTPSFYGGLIANAKFLNQKLNVNVNSYYFSEQVYQTKYEKEDKVFVVDPKLVLNAKISYQVIEQGNVFINGRNLISDSREFPYMDKIGPIFMAGININF